MTQTNIFDSNNPATVLAIKEAAKSYIMECIQSESFNSLLEATGTKLYDVATISKLATAMCLGYAIAKLEE